MKIRCAQSKLAPQARHTMCQSMLYCDVDVRMFAGCSFSQWLQWFYCAISSISISTALPTHPAKPCSSSSSTKPCLPRGVPGPTSLWIPRISTCTYTCCWVSGHSWLPWLPGTTCNRLPWLPTSTFIWLPWLPSCSTNRGLY